MAGYPFRDTTAANADDKGDKQPLGEGTVKTKPTGEKSRLLPSGGLCPFSVVSPWVALDLLCAWRAGHAVTMPDPSTALSVNDSVPFCFLVTFSESRLSCRCPDGGMIPGAAEHPVKRSRTG